MGLFDFLRKKKEPNLDDIVSSIMLQAFPNGKQQVYAIASYLYKEFNGKYPESSLVKSIAYCGSLLITSNDKSASRVVDMGMLLKPENKYTREDAIVIYKSVVKSYFSTNLGIDDEEAFEAFYKSLGNIGNSVEIVNKRIKGSFGTYGVSLTNPVPIKGVQASYSFLDRLLTCSGEQILYKRLGSYSCSITTELIDGYAISTKAGRPLGTIYICGYCSIDNPDPPVGFILKGMPTTQVSSSSNQSSITEHTSSSTQGSTSTRLSNRSCRVIPTMIRPTPMDELLKKVKRANLTTEINTIFEKNQIHTNYNAKITISAFHDIISDHIKYIRDNPSLNKEKQESRINFISEHIKYFFKIGVAVYLVHNEYGEYVGRWSEQQYNCFIDSLKNRSFMIYYDKLASFDNCIDDISRLEDCFINASEQFYQEYNEECIKEIETICRTAYYAGFRYCLLKFGDGFLRPKLSEKDYGTFKVSQNICNALSYGYKNNLLPLEEFASDETIASQYKDVASVIWNYYHSDLLDEKKYYSAIGNGVTAAVHAGIEVVLLSIKSNLKEYLTDERISNLAITKSFIAQYPFLKKLSITNFVCEMTNGSNILNVKDSTVKEAMMRDLCADSFLLGMSIALLTK